MPPLPVTFMIPIFTTHHRRNDVEVLALDGKKKKKMERPFVKTQRRSCADGSEANRAAEQRRDQEAEGAEL